jgi:hypothetical protein
MTKNLTDAWRYDSFIVVRIHTHRITLQVKSKLTKLDMFELVLMQIWPPPNSSIYDMREAFSAGNLQ